MEVGDILRYRLKNPLLDLNHSTYSVSEFDTSQLEKEFLEGIPLSYLLEMSEFYNHRYFVNSNVLIPRPETEYLVDMIVEELKGRVEKVLDVGTGSGVILLSLLSHGVGKAGVGVDISEKALEVATINTHRLRLEDKVTLLKSDRLDKVTETFDLIVSNPPYIKSVSSRNLVQDSVDKYEPHDALYLPDDYYGQWFEDFFAEVRSQLDGIFFMEGHELELDAQATLLKNLGFQDVKVIKDLSGAKRYLRATYSSQV